MGKDNQDYFRMAERITNRLWNRSRPYHHEMFGNFNGAHNFVDDEVTDIFSAFLLGTAEMEDRLISEGRWPSDCEDFREARGVAREILDLWRIIPEGMMDQVEVDTQGRDVQLRNFLS